MSDPEVRLDEESLISLSMEPKLKESKDSLLFHQNLRKSSFDPVNILKVNLKLIQESDSFAPRVLKNSLDLLNSNLNW